MASVFKFELHSLVYHRKSDAEAVVMGRLFMGGGRANIYDIAFNPYDGILVEESTIELRLHPNEFPPERDF